MFDLFFHIHHFLFFVLLTLHILLYSIINECQ
ncbi:hypothetical protein [Staphylococcus phage PT94]